MSFTDGVTGAVALTVNLKVRFTVTSPVPPSGPVCVNDTFEPAAAITFRITASPAVVALRSVLLIEPSSIDSPLSCVLATYLFPKLFCDVFRSFQTI